MPIRITANRIYFNDGSYIESANINPDDGLPSGTRMFFYQTNPPTGWTKVTTLNNMALRVVSGTASSYTGGMTFTSAFASRTVSGNVSITLANHSFSTGLKSPSLTLQDSTITGFNISAPTIDNSGTIGVNVTAFLQNINTTTGYTDITESQYYTISRVSGGMDSHTHTTPNTEVPSISYNISTIHSDELGSSIQIVYPYESATINTTSGTTGSYGTDSDHEHGQGTIQMESSGDHNHAIELSHHHLGNTMNMSSHSHTNYSISGSFDSSGTHSHTLNVGNHSHTANLSHSVTASFNGDNMDFTVKYIDLILAQKD